MTFTASTYVLDRRALDGHAVPQWGQRLKGDLEQYPALAERAVAALVLRWAPDRDHFDAYPIGTTLTPSWPFARHTDATRERAQAGAGAIRSS